MNTDAEKQEGGTPRAKMRWMRRFYRCCTAGLCTSVVLLMLPANCKPYLIHRFCTDGTTVGSDGSSLYLIDLTTTEKGFGPSGLVLGHHAVLYEDPVSAHLDPIRQHWAVARNEPPPPSTIDTRRLMWDGWGPSCTNTPTGVGVAESGEYFCLPYSAMIIGFGVPLVWMLFGRPFRGKKFHSNRLWLGA
jgi:hypothetical protein